MLPTRIAIPEADRTRMADLLLTLTATSLDLALRAKQAHWSVRGPFFAPLHALFDEVATLGQAWADETAERMAALGAAVPAYPAAVVKYSALVAASETPLSTLSSRDHLTAVADALGTYANTVRTGVDTATKTGDQGTATLLADLVVAADKALWKCEATLQAPKV
jgi:starvation-inducible DNA-binding protein